MLEIGPITSGEDTDINQRIARRVRELRMVRGHTLDVLATRCGVSRSMISLIERGQASPTAAVLDKLAGGLGVPLATLFGTESQGQSAQPLVRHTQQALWRDPESSYLRRALSPPGWPSPMQLVEVYFPAGARVAYESSGGEKTVQLQLWLLEGRMDIRLGEQLHELHAGDCLAMRLDQPLLYSNPTTHTARYLIASCDEAIPAGLRSA